MSYHGHVIEATCYGPGIVSVRCGGEDIIFYSVEDAKEYIDKEME